MDFGQQHLFLEKDTLAEARQFVQAHKSEGVTCPACDQFCKIYERQIHSTIAKGLINFYWINQRHKDEFIHVDRICPDHKTGSEFSKLSMWNMIEKCPKDPMDTVRRTSGFWKLTDIGIAFVEKKITVPRIKFVYNDLVLGESDDKVDIIQCLKKRFNYAELMGRDSQ